MNRKDFDEAIEEIYSNTSLCLAEALHKYHEFYHSQECIKKPLFNFVTFAAHKILADYLAKDVKPISWEKYKQGFMDEVSFRNTQLFNYKPFEYPSISIYIGEAELDKLQKRFMELTRN